jgi:hypothetical protein
MGGPDTNLLNDIFYADSHKGFGVNNSNNVIFNNIFYTTRDPLPTYDHNGKWFDTYRPEWNDPDVLLFDSNVFYSPNGKTIMAASPNNINRKLSNPNFVNPGTIPNGSGGTGLNTCKGYMLQSSLPGTTAYGVGKKDFFGNPIPGIPDIGACQN